MAMTTDEITVEALSLPAEARAELVDRLVESLDPADDPELRKVWAAAAERRLEEMRSGKVKPIPMEAALERVYRAIGR